MSAAVEITDREVLDRAQKLYVVMKMAGRQRKGKKRVKFTAQSLSAASLGVLHEVEAKGYRISDCLGALVIDPADWPRQVACIHFNGRVYETSPAEWGPFLP